MSNQVQHTSKKPSAILLTQILFYLAAIVNLVNGFYAIGSDATNKMILAVVMIIFGIASVLVAARLGHRDASRRNHAIILAWVLIVLRIVEYTVWLNLGFLLGIILPILMLWRLNKAEAKSWYGLS
jgi:uncharacterized membrane protein YhaH (DUF805 family)